MFSARYPMEVAPGIDMDRVENLGGAFGFSTPSDLAAQGD